MPLPNRVDPFGNLFADPARGLIFGNRGGRFHRDDRTLGARRWVSRRWICCVLEFKGRHRKVWGAGYTELFFLDEPTAFAAGHRPCFECRRADALAFAAAFPGEQGTARRADDIDSPSMRCPTAPFSRSLTNQMLPSPCAALSCCAGHHRVTRSGVRVRTK